MSIIAIIPARSGSKRIPRKNIKEFCGKPIITYSIQAAKESGIFDEIMVSTDDKEIAGISKQSGATIPFYRSEKTANDYATIRDVVKEVLDNYRSNNKVFDYYAIIYATAPMIKAEYLREAYELLLKSQESFLLPVVRYSYPPQRSQRICEGLLKWNFPNNYATRTQDLEPWYHDVGMFSIGKVEDFYRIPPAERRKIPYILDETEVQDIDTEEDWRIAEFKYLMKKEMK